MSPNLANKPVVLAIAGFDPSGGAGIIADLRTIESSRCTAVAAITSITFQNAQTYSGARHQSAAAVRAQVNAIVSQHQIAAVKIGMLPTKEIVREVAQIIRELQLPSVVDPVMKSTTGGKLMADEAYETFVTELLPLARVVMPNIPEAEKLAGENIASENQMRQAAARIRELGARAVLIKGGHLGTQSRVLQSVDEAAGGTPAYPVEAIDVLDDGGEVQVFRNKWIDAPNVRGTGCILSSAVACGLAKGDELPQAIAAAKEFVSQVIQNSTFKIQDSRLKTRN
jgi:hydroxymethylpyrimidine kinase/phosphomethylpyrimidine kinase